MPTTLTASLRFSAAAALDKDPEGPAPASAAAAVAGAGGAGLTVEFADGTGSGQANGMYAATLTLAAGTGQSLNLRTAGGLLDALNAAVNWSALKSLVVQVREPDGTKSVRVGPQGTAAAAQLWFAGVAAGDYHTVRNWMVWQDQYTGWVLSDSAGVVRLHNPGAGTITVDVLAIGVKA